MYCRGVRAKWGGHGGGWCLRLGGNYGGTEGCSDSGYILRVESMRLVQSLGGRKADRK